MIKIKEKAPLFSAYDSNNILHNLSDFLGQKVILYFYPKDNTSGCTTQACGFAKLYNDFKALNTIIIGISKDSVKSHANFVNKYQLPFILLADTDREIITKYEVLKPKKMFGKEVIGTHRTTYLIDEKGFIIGIYKDVDPLENPYSMLKIIKQLL